MTASAGERLGTHGEKGTPVYAYGVVPAGAQAPARTGVLGGTVRLVEAGPVAALVSDVRDDRVRAKRRDLLAHSDVLQECHAAGVVLPLRFGTLFASEVELCATLLEARRDELVSLLDRFAGVGELRVRAVYQDQESVLANIVAEDPAIAKLRAATRSGTAREADLIRLGELVAKAYEARRAADADAVVDRLAAHALDVSVDERSDELTVVKASFLVRGRDRARFDEALESVALRLRHLLTFTCTGPLPPHSFVSLDGTGAA
jgi:Gas vesicle synthesis protein GvpL/GvpF